MNSLTTAMPYANNWLLIAGIVIVFCSVVLQWRDKERAAVFLLFMGALCIRIFAAHLDAFLHEWDECFHALVARNMMHHPFKPMLRVDPQIAYDYRSWSGNHIWLHKQPLFLWQMALSMKIFGVSEYAVRYPGALMGAIMVLFIYRITLLLAKDKHLAFVAALFMCFSHYQADLISGVKGMDHNDMAFGFYVLASVWAYVEYLQNKSYKWIFLIGLFAGCAILNKWLTGLLVFALWGINLLLSIRDRESRAELLHMLLALSVCVVVFLPWQLYILYSFPAEAKYEYAFNTKHVFEVVEEHKGGIWYYWDNMGLYFGEYTWFLLLPGFILLFTKKYRKNIGIALIAAILIVFSFFSFIVQTKIDSYFFAVAPLCFICMALGFVRLMKWCRLPVFVYLFISFIVALIIFDFKHTTLSHDPRDPSRIAKIHNTIILKDIRKLIPPGTRTVLNCKVHEDIELMFYHNDIDAYAWCLYEADVAQLKKHNIPITVFEDRFGYPIPAFVWEYPGVFIIHQQLK